MPAQFIHIKSAMTSNLIFFNTLLRLVICMLEDSMNLALFLLLMEIITCFLEELFVVMFNLGLGFLILLIILQILSILFVFCLRKFSLIFRILLVFGNKACTYDFPISFFLVSLVFFLKILEISLISLEVFTRIGDYNFTKLTGLSIVLLLLIVFLVS